MDRSGPEAAGSDEAGRLLLRFLSGSGLHPAVTEIAAGSRPLFPGWKLLRIEIAVCISHDLVEQLIGGESVLIQGITFLR